MPPKGVKAKGKARATAVGSEAADEPGSKKRTTKKKARLAEDEPSDEESDETPIAPKAKKQKSTPRAKANTKKRARSLDSLNDLEPDVGEVKKKAKPTINASRGRKPRKTPQPAKKTATKKPSILNLDLIDGLPEELQQKCFREVLVGVAPDKDSAYGQGLVKLSLAQSTNDLTVISQQPDDLCPVLFQSLPNTDFEKTVKPGLKGGGDGKYRFNKFFAMTSDRIWFEFDHPNELCLLAERLPVWLHSDTSRKSKVNIRLHLFIHKDWAALRDYVGGLQLPHGYDLDAEGHWNLWMDAVDLLAEAGQKVDIDIKIDIVFYEPWRNYLAIRAQSRKSLRSASPLNQTMNIGSIKLGELYTRNEAWNEVDAAEGEDRKTHLTLLACAVYDCPLPTSLDLEQERVTRMVDHGCLGVRIPLATEALDN